MARTNVFTKLGRPKGSRAAGQRQMPDMGTPSLGGMPGGGASPMAGFSPAVPGAAFRQGGSVNGFKKMASHHDDERLRSGHSEHGHEDMHNHCRGGRAR